VTALACFGPPLATLLVAGGGPAAVVGEDGVATGSLTLEGIEEVLRRR